MKFKHAILSAACLGFLACSSATSTAKLEGSESSARSSALQCLDQGNLSCAQENFCGQQSAHPEDVQAALRCCVSQFLNIAFSENTQDLGKKLGYHPLPFGDLKSRSLRDLISGKHLVFGELLFLPQGQAPRLRDLLMDWGSALTRDHASTRALSSHFIRLGQDLEKVSACLEKIPAGFAEDDLEGDFFGSPEKTKITPRDLAFLKFASASLGYLFQSAFEYEWGFENFPSWPFEDSFYEDINGKQSAGDRKFGDLNAEAAPRVASKGALLQKGLRSFEDFLSQSRIGLIDAWLRWRFSQEDLIAYTSVLRSASASMEQGLWMSVSGEDFIVNASSLLQAPSLPNASTIPASMELLKKDATGSPEVDSDYLKWLFIRLVNFPLN